jgi:serine/threonine-protein kinase
VNEVTEQPVDTAVSGNPLETTAAVPVEALGSNRRIGPYRLIRELGHGGMGTVFLAARADDQFEKRVALKVVRSSDSEEVVRFFRRERQILASLEHPNIARLLDGGTTEEGLPYFVMEHIEGDPIDQYCDRRKLSIAERLELFDGVLSAVQYAHRSLVVHRDLKPGNILVTADGIPKLLDFGIAKILSPVVAGGHSTETVVAMTPEYASPEQVRGRAITTATDVYSLGVILYELLTGQKPYRVKSREHLEVLKAVCEEEPDRPSTAVGRTSERREPDGTVTTSTPEETGRLRHETPQRLKKRLKGDLDAIVLGALQKDPVQRYRSVEALSEDLRRYREGKPVTVRKSTRLYRLLKLCGRHKLAVAATLTIAGLLVALAVTNTVQASRLRTQRDRVTAESAKVTAMNDFLQSALGAADPWEKGSRNVSLLDALRQAQAKAEAGFEGQPLIGAAVLETIGNTFGSLAEFGEGEKALRRSLGLRETAAGPRSAEAARSLVSLSSLYSQWRKFDEAERYARQALDISREVNGPDSLETGMAMVALGQTMERKGDIKALKPLAQQILAIGRSPHPGTRTPATAAADRAKIEDDALEMLASVALEEQDYKSMESLDRERLAKLRAQRPEPRADVAQAMNNLATAQMLSGDLAGAEANYKEALTRLIAVLGEDHPEVATTMENLGNVYFRSGRYDETSRNLEVVLAMRRKALGDDSEPVGRTLANMGTVYKRAGKKEEAERSYRQALGILSVKLGPESLDVAAVRMYLGDLLKQEGKLDEADGLLRESLATRARVLGETHAATQSVIKDLAELSTARGKPEEAAAYTARLVPAK